MRIINRTKLDDVMLARVLNAVTPRGLSDQIVVIYEPTLGPCPRGIAWAAGTKFPGSTAQASIYVPLEPRFPHYPPSLDRRENGKIVRPARLGWTVALRNLEESLVYVTAHELGHLRYGPSERLAHAWGLRMVRRYRARPLPMPASIKATELAA